MSIARGFPAPADAPLELEHQANEVHGMAKMNGAKDGLALDKDAFFGPE